jgi:hypothetical protein
VHPKRDAMSQRHSTAAVQRVGHLGDSDDMPLRLHRISVRRSVRARNDGMYQRHPAGAVQLIGGVGDSDDLHIRLHGIRVRRDVHARNHEVQ